MHEGEPAGALDLVELVEQGGAIVVEDDLGAVALHRVELGARRVGRHHDDALRADVARGPRDRLRVVACRDGDDAARALGGSEREHLGERASRLERTGLLEELTLEPKLDADAIPERSGGDERRLVHDSGDPLGGGANLGEGDHRAERRPARAPRTATTIARTRVADVASDAMPIGHEGRDRRLARRRATPLLAVSLGAALSLGCVRRAEYDAVAADLLAARDEAHAMSLEAERLRVEALRLEADTRKARADKQELETKDAELARNAEDLALMNTELMNRLKGAGQSVEQLAHERGGLEQALTTTRPELADWRKQQAALGARSAQQQKLDAALRQAPDTQGLDLGIRGGHLVLTLPSDTFFEPGSVSVKAAGRPTLLRTAQALRGISGRHFRVVAHVDAARAASSGAPGISLDWQLSASRALAVTRELILAGVPASSLSAAAGAEYDPVDNDDTPAGHSRSRRIEIVFEPLPDEMGKPKP